jgi:hypothetical protein
VVLRLKHAFNVALLKQLFIAGIIEGFERQGSYILIKLPTAFQKGHLSLFSGGHLVDTISSYPKPRHGGINYKAKTIQKQTRFAGQSCVIFFNTDKGVIDNSLASSSKTGGQPLFQVK